VPWDIPRAGLPVPVPPNRHFQHQLRVYIAYCRSGERCPRHAVHDVAFPDHVFRFDPLVDQLAFIAQHQVVGQCAIGWRQCRCIRGARHRRWQSHENVILAVHDRVKGNHGPLHLEIAVSRAVGQALHQTQGAFHRCTGEVRQIVVEDFVILAGDADPPVLGFECPRKKLPATKATIPVAQGQGTFAFGKGVVEEHVSQNLLDTISESRHCIVRK